MKCSRLGVWFLCWCLIGTVGVWTDLANAQDEKSQDETRQEEKTQQEEKGKQEEKAKQEEKQSETAEKSDTEKSVTKDAAGTEQGAEQPKSEEEAAADLETLKVQWQELNARMDETKKNFDENDSPQESAKLRDQYVSLIDEANELIGKIKAAAMERIMAGDLAQDVVETVVGIMINDAVFERDEEVLFTGQQLIDAGVEAKYFEMAAKAKRLNIAGSEIFSELLTRQKETAADDLPRVKLTTSKGDIVLELFENEAPQTVGNFVNLVESGFYAGIKFHRVLDGFMAQVGDPLTKEESEREKWGTGGPGYNIYCECYEPDARRHFTGSLSMAKERARDTGGSQFFITFARTSHLDGKHTVFGRVIEGMDVVNSLQRINPEIPSNVEPDQIISAEVLRKRDHEYVPTKVDN